MAQFRTPPTRTSRLMAAWIVSIVGALALAPPGAAAQDRLVDREPFDRIQLDNANQNRQLDILPNAFPNRQVPDPMPRSGTLRVRLVDNPLDELDVRWTNIVEVRLFEQLVLDEAKQLARDGRYAEAHEYLAYLNRYHGELPGLDRAVQSVLEMEVADAFQRGNFERAWMVLTALYDRNDDHSGLSQAFGNVTERLLEAHVTAQDFAEARRFLDLLQSRFGKLGSDIASRWDERLRRLALESVAAARRHFEADRLDEAREAVRAALAVVPHLSEARTLWRQIAAARPRLVVGVTAESPARLTRRIDDWPSRRVASLVDPPLVELRGFGAEGGEYRSPYGQILQEAGGMGTSLVLPRQATTQAPTPHAVARHLVSLAQSSPRGLGDVLVSQLVEVAVEGAQTLRLRWRHAQVRPEALLRIGFSSGVKFGAFELDRRSADETVFVRKHQHSTSRKASPVEIVELLFESEDDAVDALLQGEVDVVERIAPAHRQRLAQQKGVVVDRYALPTVHALLPSATRPLMQLSELRRAILYGIDRETIVKQFFAGDGMPGGGTVVSGPFPPGSDFTDPVAYAYDRAIEPRPFDPRLAATLASVAARLHDTPKSRAANDDKQHDLTDGDLPELVLAHPPEPLARALCQTIAAQLNAIDIPMRLEEVAPHELEVRQDEFDLLYAELAMWEPLVDARRLLGPRGESPGCSARMGLALSRMDHARNWQEVRESLYEVHRVAFDELSVLPLWQTTNYFAYADVVRGLPPQPVSLYQNVETWRLTRATEADGE